MVRRVAVLGAGAWGRALANVVARPGRDVVLWARRPDLAAAMTAQRENAAALPGVRLDDGIRASSDLGAIEAAEVVLAVVPAQQLRLVLDALPRLGVDMPIVEAVTEILAGRLAPRTAVDRLLSRPVKAEANLFPTSTD